LLPVLGIRVDPDDGSVWANSWSEEKGRSELLHFDASGQLLRRYAMEDSAKHGFNDLVVRKGGAVLLTDTLSNQVYQFDRLSKDFTAVVLQRPLTEPNGIALSDDNAQLFVADDFGVQRLDFKSGVSSEVRPGPRNTLAGVDGLYWHRGSLIGIQNAIGSPRIVAWRLSKDASTVTHTTVLEYRSALLTGEPTTGAIKGDDFYFIVNSQGENMEGDHVADPSKLERVRIGVLRLP
jgi:DNA-binding beta-propeller fold protein YncE